jgi:hypothetical protein
MNARMGIPLRADRYALARESSSAVIRAVIASAIAGRTGDPELIARGMWPSDRLTGNVVKSMTRATSNPAALDVPTWAQELGRSVVADYLAGLGEVSAASEIFKLALNLSFNIDREHKAAEIRIPHFIAAHGNAGFFVPGQLIPVHSLSLTDPDVLTPHWIGAIGVFTNEMLQSSNVEALATDTMNRAVGRALDEVLFDANPLDQARPAGLRNGVAAIPPSSKTGEEGYLEDMGNLATAVSPIAANSPLVYVASPGRALQIKLRMARDIDGVYVYGSSAALLIVPAALAVIAGAAPRIEDSGSTIIETAGGKTSMFQIDGTARKLILPVTWSRRDPRAFAWTTPAW